MTTIAEDMAALKDKIRLAIDTEIYTFKQKWEISPSAVGIDMEETTDASDHVRQFSVGEVHLEFQA